MRSPRFDIRAAKLRAIFSPSNIERIWKDKVRQHMKDQFINDGIENFDFHVGRKLESKKLSQIILSGDYLPQKAQRILLEKSKGLCRQLVIPAVQDAIVLQCLSDALYSEIKGRAPTKKSFFEPKDHKFSSDQTGYGSFSAWLNFQKALFNFSKTRNFVVVTDIANYYDSISYVHLRNAISSISGVEECIIDMLIYVLSDLLWQPDYTPRIEIGLPQINLDAPRLLAHCFLYELDSFLASDPAIDFVRFMDDIDIGVDSIVEAKKVLRSVDLVLQTKQIRLNSGKTTILTRDEAIKHFRVLENARIDSFKSSVKHRIKSGLSLARHRRVVELRISRGIRNKLFDNGNGEKILKRWLGLASQTDAKIKPEMLESLIKLRPSVRDSVYGLIRSRPLTPSIAKILARSASSGLLVDDAAMVSMANNLVETLVESKRCHLYIKDIIESNDQKQYFGLYSKLWLQSKYGTTDELLMTLRDTEFFWVPHQRLGRLVASFYPLFQNSAEETAFKELLGRTFNPGVREVYKFHASLLKEKDVFNHMFDALKSPNTTRGTGITHAKFLCLLSALRNMSATSHQITVLKTKNYLVFKDCYYKSIAKRLKII
ncbi:hypothetical protein AZL_a08220 (plasmid) [Azospirillum sp. B510]|uniref:RNA-directed DNA polymerase n=1 Tax=Azospirillum sp. (strain B510) TaxID=137722 RepID=UPI0001C4BB1B|nr:RNA-directed DNA polymerase [Azospirillum sp. B510]BAI74353.1 hypothetical protein AZL_a08220 [Azospirillum sp. B510]